MICWEVWTPLWEQSRVFKETTSSRGTTRFYLYTWEATQSDFFVITAVRNNKTENKQHFWDLSKVVLSRSLSISSCWHSFQFSFFLSDFISKCPREERFEDNDDTEHCFCIQTRSNRPYVSILKTRFLIDIYKRWFLFSNLWKKTGRLVKTELSWWAKNVFMSPTFKGLQKWEGSSERWFTKYSVNNKFSLVFMKVKKKNPVFMSHSPSWGLTRNHSNVINACIHTCIEHLLCASSYSNEKGIVWEKSSLRCNPPPHIVDQE